MVAAYKREYSLADSADVFMVFEGERLQPTDVMRDSEIGDLDCVDVHIR